MAGNRLDQALVERGLCESREKAQRAIMAGQVLVNQQPARKASERVSPADNLTLAATDKYVSRGGLKLEHALHHFQLDVTGQTAIDLGASTGGFTDCLLQHGVTRVYAVDVGHGQLAWKLRHDPRVIVMEKTNAREAKPTNFQVALERMNKAAAHPSFSPTEGEGARRADEGAASANKSASGFQRNPLTPALSPSGGEGEEGDTFTPVDLVVIDCSFISLRRILPVAVALLRTSGRIVPLIKPQFEAGKAEADKGKGVITDPAIHARVLRELESFVRDQPQLSWLGSVESPLLGPAGNKEFFALIEKTGQSN